MNHPQILLLRVRRLWDSQYSGVDLTFGWVHLLKEAICLQVTRKAPVQSSIQV